MPLTLLRDKKIVIIGLLSILIVISLILFKSNNDDLPNIILIVMDTVRQDHLACYEYTRNTTPNLNRLVETSRIYSNAYSTSCWTIPAHASLFTGLYPIAHQTTQEHWKMSGETTTLAEILRKNGYETYGIIGNSVIGKHTNLDQGFSQYYEAWRDVEKDGEEHNNLFYFKQCMQQRNKKKPFFIFINFIEPHSPYDAPLRFQEQFVSDFSLDLKENFWGMHYLGMVRFSQDQLQHLIELFDAEILYVDYLIGKIIEELKEKELWNDTVFIVTGDHGENFGEHNHMGHAFSLYESTIKIPLIIHYPKSFLPKSEDHDMTQITDIFTTILGIAVIGGEGYFSQGVDLLKPDARKRRAAFAEYYYPIHDLDRFTEGEKNHPRLEPFKRRLRAIIVDNKKFIWGSDGNHELYDFAKDPEEKENLVDRDTGIEKEMKEKMQNMIARYELKENTYLDETEIVIDEETKKSLKELGYLK